MSKEVVATMLLIRTHLLELISDMGMGFLSEPWPWREPLLFPKQFHQGLYLISLKPPFSNALSYYAQLYQRI